MNYVRTFENGLSVSDYPPYLAEQDWDEWATILEWITSRKSRGKSVTDLLAQAAFLHKVNRIGDFTTSGNWKNHSTPRPEIRYWRKIYPCLAKSRDSSGWHSPTFGWTR